METFQSITGRGFLLATCSNSQFFPAARPWGPLWDWVEPSAQPLAKITYSFTQLTNLVWLWICWAPRIASACRWKGCWIQEISQGGLVSLWADVYNIPAAVDDFRSTEVCSEDLFRRCPLWAEVRTVTSVQICNGLGWRLHFGLH